ncbi:hypothetical protein CFP56_013980 [Quercus suber]|uniref:Uncharacterized protein n=1 Tax=Quercus suber TaxID=58331 RepID=A0AAW0KVP4_QUESU
MMESGRLFFDPSACRGSNMLFLGNGDNVFRVRAISILAEPFLAFYESYSPRVRAKIDIQVVSIASISSNVFHTSKSIARAIVETNLCDTGLVPLLNSRAKEAARFQNRVLFLLNKDA